MCSVVSNSFVTPWTVARHAPLSKQFYSKEYWSGLPFPPPVDLPDPEIEPNSLASPALADGFFRLADAVFSRNPAHRQKKLERILLEVKKSVVPIRPDDGNTPRYENTRKSSHHHNKRHNL